MLLIECEIIPPQAGKVTERAAYTQILGDVGITIVLMSIFQRVKVFGRVLKVLSWAG